MVVMVCCLTVMRADGVLRLLMNASLFAGMVCDIGQDPKFIKISTFEEGAFVHHAIKVRLPLQPFPSRSSGSDSRLLGWDLTSNRLACKGRESEIGPGARGDDT